MGKGRRRRERGDTTASEATFSVSLEDRMVRLHGAFTDLQEQHLETRRLIPNDDTLRSLIRDVYEADCGRLERLRDDAVTLLEVMVTKGLVSRDDVNAAIAGARDTARDTARENDEAPPTTLTSGDV